jgi:hypothetical protein
MAVSTIIKAITTKAILRNDLRNTTNNTGTTVIIAANIRIRKNVKSLII